MKMGFAVVMFGILLVMSVVMVTAITYGVAKDSQIAPLKAENIYAERETGKAQTGLTIVNTCLSYPDRYINASGATLISGPHTLNLVVKNNRSTVLKPNISTVLFNASYTNFTVAGINDTWASGGNLGIGGFRCDEWEEEEGCEEYDVTRGFCYQDTDAGEHNPNYGIAINVWPPLTYVCMKAPNVFIPTPDSPAPGVPLRLAVLAENGVSTIAPTSPTNFNGIYVNGTYNYTLSWDPSYDADGIAYYRLYGINGSQYIGTCTYYQNYSVIPGSRTTLTIRGSNPEWFYVTAVDTLQNEGIQSRTIKCTNSGCTY
jgi:archaellum component FlaF (FlaF/FlaG flagellin family)